ncbi:MBOAT family protein [Candidatus Sumerlaeota bacterium]|nr:MBOAT family protein [Candidatus Sumerlaeota bacterium]
MSFVSLTYLVFLPAVLLCYWLIPNLRFQNLFLVIINYLFYGWIHPCWCILIAISTVFDFWLGICLEKFPYRRRTFVTLSLCYNLGFLAFFKYFGFFAENVQAAANVLGFQLSPFTIRVLLPAGISFYTFQSIGYIVDVYRGHVKAQRNFIDFALFVSFFPQLVAGPIERASHLLPQIMRPRKWHNKILLDALPLILVGVMKKLVIADNIAVIVDRIFMLQQPTLLFLIVGTVAFSIQIYYDFSGYTDIARGSAGLLGFSLMENFRKPYAAISPSDFWRRWHISFSTWIRDYLYIPLGGSRVPSRWKFAAILLATMTISGLWHGAAWNFVLWGFFHGFVLLAYHLAGCGGRWEPSTKLGWMGSWLLMQTFVLVGWMFFRIPSIHWLIGAVPNMHFIGTDVELISTISVAVSLLFFAMPAAIVSGILHFDKPNSLIRSILMGFALFMIVIFLRGSGNDFIYFRF